MNYQKIVILLLCCTLIVLVLLLWSLLSDLLVFPNTDQPTQLSSQQKTNTASQISHPISDKCEIIVTSKNEDYLKDLIHTYPNCKVINKSELYKFNLIHQLLLLFDH